MAKKTDLILVAQDRELEAILAKRHALEANGWCRIPNGSWILKKDLVKVSVGLSIDEAFSVLVYELRKKACLMSLHEWRFSERTLNGAYFQCEKCSRRLWVNLRSSDRDEHSPIVEEDLETWDVDSNCEFEIVKAIMKS